MIGADHEQETIKITEEFMCFEIDEYSSGYYSRQLFTLWVKLD